jgi:hypothetical protein
VMKTGEKLLVTQSSTQIGCGTGDGALCSVPQNGQPAACGCPTILPLDQIAAAPSQSIKSNQASAWDSIRSGVMFVVACIASPCCTPLIVPLVLGLLGSTPIAVWMGHNLGLIYGALTLLSAISFVLALRWMKTDPRKRASLPSIKPIKS